MLRRYVAAESDADIEHPATNIDRGDLDRITRCYGPVTLAYIAMSKTLPSLTQAFRNTPSR